MTYTYKCAGCGHVEAITGVHSEDRKTTRSCPECAEVTFEYDFVLTMRATGKSLCVREDTVSYVTRRFGNTDGFQPPTSSGPRGRCSPGGARNFPGQHENKWS